MVTPKSMNHTIFWKNSKRSFWITVPAVLLSLAKIQKMSLFDILITLVFTYSSSSISWSISFLHFKTFKIQFYGVPPLHFFLVSKIHIYMSKITRSSLLTWISFFYIEFPDFWYITCSVPNLIPIWSRSHGLTWKRVQNRIIYELCTDDNKSKYSRNPKNILKSAKKIKNYQKLYTKQTSTATTTE